MDQKDHIATLCALGTVGIAASGLAFGTTEADSYLVRPGKRKWPGSQPSSPMVPFQTSNFPRRAASQPSTIDARNADTPVSSLGTVIRRRTTRDTRKRTQQFEEDDPPTSESRASSASRRSILRPWTAETKSSTERREPSSSSSWLKRMSSISSTHGSSPASSIQQERPTTAELRSGSPMRPQTSDTSLPNKLVKRATSQRALSKEHAKGQILRRPATSHQRSQTLITSMDTNFSKKLPDASSDGQWANSKTPALTIQMWRPFFTSSHSRKRRSSGALLQDEQIRTVSVPYLRCPTLLMGTKVEPRLADDIDDDQDRAFPHAPLETRPVNKHKLRRSLSSIRRSQRRRNYTDPTAQMTRAEASGFIVQTEKQSSLSPVSNVSTFEVELPQGTPSFTSSPPMTRSDHSFTVRKRSSAAFSEPPTTSSDNDNDIHVFTDDDSMDFHSDTNYNSIATRITSSGRTGLRISKLETIFAERHSDEMNDNPVTLEDLMKRASLRDEDFLENSADGNTTDTHETSVASIHDEANLDARISTPISSGSVNMEDINATPVPVKHGSDVLLSSPPLFPIKQNSKSFEFVGDMIEDTEINDSNDLDWALTEKPSSGHQNSSGSPFDSLNDTQYLSSPNHKYYQSQIGHIQQREARTDKSSSIFDWSEQQHSGNGSRPRTVHGKQGQENRSRSTGRKEMHLRSHSVPVGREPVKEDTPQSTSKFSTWGLGHKPVSEEWSDDFDFDDVEDSPVPQTNHDERQPNPRDSVRSVKVPQSIIDRQASVHLQFGQVQEFMLLVEELKRLRARALILNLLESNSKQLWEDAESIINLATINDEDDTPRVPQSPTSSDIFTDETSNGARAMKDNNPPAEPKRVPATRRSISTTATPSLVSRARSDSLAQAKNFLQTIHQNRTGHESSPREIEIHQQKKLPFDTQDLRDLVVRSGVITRALIDIVRHAEGLSTSPQKTPTKRPDPPFSKIFNVPEEGDVSPCPPFRKPGLPKSRSANSYLETSTKETKQGESFSTRLSLTAMV